MKPNKSIDPGGARNNLKQRGGTVQFTKFSLRMLMGQAYSESDNLRSLNDASTRIIGLPTWADSDYYDIEAKADGDSSPPAKRLMLQSLLADRFKLKLHREAQQRPVYALVAVNPRTFGPQLLTHEDSVSCEVDSQPGAGKSAPRSPAEAAWLALQQFPCSRIAGGLLPGDPNQAWAGGRDVTMAAIAESIAQSEPFDRPVVDRTGIAGRFDFTVVWHTLLQDLSTSPPSDPSGVSLTQAIRDQLGLQLASQSAQVQILVVDHVERPSGN